MDNFGLSSEISNEGVLVDEMAVLRITQQKTSQHQSDYIIAFPYDMWNQMNSLFQTSAKCWRKMCFYIIFMNYYFLNFLDDYYDAFDVL